MPVTKVGCTIVLIDISDRGTLPLSSSHDMEVIALIDEFHNTEVVEVFLSSNAFLDVRLFRTSRKNKGKDLIRICAQAKYETCLIVRSSEVIPSSMFDLVFDGVVGVAGANLSTDGRIESIYDVDVLTQVSIVTYPVIRVPRYVFHHHIFNNPWDTRTNTDVWISFVATQKLNLPCVVVPVDVDSVSSKSFSLQDEQIILISTLFLNGDFDWIRWYRESYFKFTERHFWESLTRSSHLNDYSLVFTLGCQRSGTTWLNGVLGKALANTFSLDEEDSLRYLVGGSRLSKLTSSMLAFQLTFMHTQLDALERLAYDSTKFLLLLRNPYSICWSLLYHHETIHLEWFYRRHFIPSDEQIRVPRHEELGWAINLFRNSMHSHRHLLHQFKDRMFVIPYDTLVNEHSLVLESIADFLEADLVPDNLGKLHISTESPNKQLGLTDLERKTISESCLPEFIDIIDTCKSLGLPGSSLLSNDKDY